MSEAVAKVREVAQRVPTLKALVVTTSGEVRPATNSITDEFAIQSLFSQAGALPMPYDPVELNQLFESTSALRPNIEAYMQNIDGNGHHLEAVINLEDDDAYKTVESAIMLERVTARRDGAQVDNIVPTADEIESRMREIETEQMVERFEVEAFLNACACRESFTSLRKKTRQDLETTGNAFWEVLRDRRGRVVQFTYLHSHTMRLLPIGQELVPTAMKVRKTPITVVDVRMQQRFRTFVQIVQNEVVYYKEFGDPRTISARTGKVYSNPMALENAERGSRAATEVIHFRIHSTSSPYGVPRWIGTLVSVLGARNADEVNLLYFENKSVPPLAVLVSGGRLTAESVQRIHDHIENEVKGKENFHSVLILEAEGSDATGENTGKMRIEIKPLTEAQQQDALFLKYDERCLDKVGFAFRIPRLLRGDSRDFNRATADAALEFAETQVFGPERIEFDFMMNQLLLGTLGVKYWTFHSNSVQLRDPQTLAEIIGQLTAHNVLVPSDARELAGELVFGRKLRRINADWTDQPVMLTQVGVPYDDAKDGKIPVKEPPPGAGDAGAGPALQPVQQRIMRRFGQGRLGSADIVTVASDLIRLRDELAEIEKQEAIERHRRAAESEKAT